MERSTRTRPVVPLSLVGTHYSGLLLFFGSTVAIRYTRSVLLP